MTLSELQTLVVQLVTLVDTRVQGKATSSDEYIYGLRHYLLTLPFEGYGAEVTVTPESVTVGPHHHNQSMPFVIDRHLPDGPTDRHFDRLRTAIWVIGKELGYKGVNDDQLDLRDDHQLSEITLVVSPRDDRLWYRISTHPRTQE